MGAKKNGGAGDGGEKKKDDNPLTVVLKVDMHCEGCASKIVKTVKGFEGVDGAKAEFEANKLTVVGKVNPSEVREMLAGKTKKKVDLISPQPSKKDDNKNDNKKKTDENDNKKKTDEKKPDKKKPKEKEHPVTTAVLKLRLHCQGCIEKINKTITKTKGFNDMSMDKQKELVTVIGSMDMKALAAILQGKLKRPVEIVPPKKEKDGGEKDGGKGDNGGGGGGKKKGGGGGGGDGGQKAEGDGGKMEEISRMEYLGQPMFGFGYGPGPGLGYGPGPGIGYGPGLGYVYPPGYVGEHLHPPQMFSDENPNACCVM